MNTLLQRLSGGDPRSDGRANEVAEEVSQDPHLLDLLFEGLSEPDDAIRARTVHALEKVSRKNQTLFQGLMPQLISLSASDSIPMVKWHLAMIFGNTASVAEDIRHVINALFRLLKDESVFVRSWAISSLCLIGRRDKRRRRKIVDAMRALQHDRSIAIRVRAGKALRALRNKNGPLPVGWSRVRRAKKGNLVACRITEELER